mgnify:CR=1 FL=1
MQYTSSIPKTIQENYTFIASDPAAHGRLSGLQKKENELPEIALIRKRVIQTKAAEQSLKETSQGNFRLRSFFKVLLLGAALTPVGRLMKNLENSPTRFDYTSVNRALVVTNTLNNVRLPTDNTGDGQQEFSPWNTTGTTSPTSENLGGGTLVVTNTLNNVYLPTNNTGDGQQEFPPSNTTTTGTILEGRESVLPNIFNNVYLPTNDTCVGQQEFPPSNTTGTILEGLESVLPNIFNILYRKTTTHDFYWDGVPQLNPTGTTNFIPNQNSFHFNLKKILLNNIPDILYQKTNNTYVNQNEVPPSNTTRTTHFIYVLGVAVIAIFARLKHQLSVKIPLVRRIQITSTKNIEETDLEEKKLSIQITSTKNIEETDLDEQKLDKMLSSWPVFVQKPLPENGQDNIEKNLLLT